MTIEIPELSLVVLIGASGSGKSTFAARHFAPTEVLSSDRFRALVSDDETDQRVSGDAFEVLHLLAAKRLKNRRLTVIDATNVEKGARDALIQVARDQHAIAHAIVLDVPPEVCLARNEQRPDRDFGPHVVEHHSALLKQSLEGLRKEGFRGVHVLGGVGDIDAASVVRRRMFHDLRSDSGPFDIIGDVHGCADELRSLLTRLGYREDGAHPMGRRVIFLGDLVDRGPKVVGVLKIAMSMVKGGRALCVMGNHEAKLSRWLNGRNVKRTHGIAQSIDQLEREPVAFREEVRDFIDTRGSHYVLDEGKLVVAHAGLREELQGRTSGRVRQLCLYGETTGDTDEFGLPVRLEWARDYSGRAAVVYGHTPVAKARWLNGTICVDTGCVFGGELSALRWPERELVSVAAREVHYAPIRPLATEPARGRFDLAWDDVAGAREIDTRHGSSVSIRNENAATALEAMSRFAIDPRWLVYLPPMLTPPEASSVEGFLEHPEEAFREYRERGLREVVCEARHTGSHAVVVVCRDESAALARFGDERLGVIYTRAGRPFFDDRSLERAVLVRLRDAAEKAGTFSTLQTGWLALEAELTPGSTNAQGRSPPDYASVSVAGAVGLDAALEALRNAPGARELLAATVARAERRRRYGEASDRYRRPAASVDEVALAPFHLLASEGRTHVDRDHAWHLSALATICAEDEGLLVATPWRSVDLADRAAMRDATAWWLELTEAGGEGIVVKPLRWLERDERGLVQPALKVRGRDYLRLVYGPDYDVPSLLERLRTRSLSGKRRLAVRGHCLGLEALARFVEEEPLHRIHECVVGVLALETIPLDPRL